LILIHSVQHLYLELKKRVHLVGVLISNFFEYNEKARLIYLRGTCGAEKNL
jgi:hypothetical protein